MIVLCIGMIRSGSTLQYNISRNLVELLQVGVGEGYFAPDSLADFQEQFVRWGQDPSLHVIKTHSVPRGIINMVASGAVRVCYIYRDLRDVAASAKSKWGYQGNALFADLDKATATYWEVQALPAVLSQRYEAVVRDIPVGVRAIAGFLGLRPAEGIIASVAKECALESATRTARSIRLNPFLRLKSILLRVGVKMRAKRILRTIGMQESMLRRIRDSMYYYDKSTLLHPDHISETAGAIGKWRTELSDREIDTLLARYRSWFLDA